jgi:hypothetical protein
VAQYHFVTDLRLPAPAHAVRDALEDTAAWPTWWRWLRTVDQLAPGGADGVGARYRVRFRTRLPYTLSFESTTVRVDPDRIESAATGDLAGTGVWELVAADPVTHLRYTWVVRTTKRWMNALAPLARPAFGWNHHRLMADFARGLAGHLGVELHSVASRAVPPTDDGFAALPPRTG